MVIIGKCGVRGDVTLCVVIFVLVSVFCLQCFIFANTKASSVLQHLIFAR